MEYKKNQKINLTITDIGVDGEGIGKIDGYTLFVKDAMPGDEIEALIMKAKKNYAYARCEKVIKPSPFRMESLCKVARPCGGCQLQNMSYEKQLDVKKNKVRNNLIRIGGFEKDFVDSVMEDIAGMEDPFHYRNKAQYPIGTDKEGNPVAGFYAGRTHSIIKADGCLIGAKSDSKVLEAVLSFMRENKILAYDEKTGRGIVRHVLIRTAQRTGQIMVCLVINAESLKASEKLVKKLTSLSFEDIDGENAYAKNTGKRNNSVKKDGTLEDKESTDEKHLHVESISISINRENTNVILGQEIQVLYGNPYITDYIGDIAFQISPLSFFQINSVQTQVLYQTALSFADLKGTETVWDLYCGIGTISLFLAQKAKKVFGVEIVPPAIEDAKRNALFNHMDNAEFYVGKAEEVLPEKYEKENIYADVIVVDPPRKGCDEACLATMTQMAPEKIVYVSCDSATLSRDLKYLCENGYEIKKVRPVDMFPMTVHVETVVLMSKKNS